MENFPFKLLLPILSFVSVALVASQAADDVSPDAYWKSVLPNAPMPKVVKEILHNGWIEDKSTSVGIGKGSVHEVIIAYSNAATETQIHDTRNIAVFFLEKDLKRGTKMNLYFTKTTNSKTTFLPRQVADKIPFSSEKMLEILDQFSVKPDTKEAEVMKKTIKECEEPGFKGEEKYCVTSLESMVDFTTSKLGKSVQAISTEVEKETNKLQEYRVSGVKKMGGGECVVCHKLKYAYAVFYCHKITATKAYVVSLVGLDGTKAKAVAVCHTNTSGWNPKHLAFHVLKVKPGTVPICHILSEDQRSTQTAKKKLEADRRKIDNEGDEEDQPEDSTKTLDATPSPFRPPRYLDLEMVEFTPDEVLVRRLVW
ncbi:hypothetical protein Vadar_013336 [Vaccinium darrowii]|uniref:Uncharacterized protein n=1 Tax=Vaccinium darrowii TaxID=229202 RepID=A0ACB7Y6M5_9ERIC|nr:hypothetical protein Vadar_013336 [Vaccinium darrowii]